MDLAYDHIVEESLLKEEDGKAKVNSGTAEQTQNSLNAEIQDAYKALSASPWGAKIGFFLGTVVKQGESVYQEAQKELTAVGGEAQRGFTGLTNAVFSRTRDLSLAITAGSSAGSDHQEVTPAETSKEMTTDEAIQESETVLSRLRSEATKRLKDIQKAEDAADEALLRFGTNIRDFLRDAVSIAPPSRQTTGGQNATVLFESKDASGKRVIHTSRFDAQLHVIHTSTESFTKDPATGDWEKWDDGFDIKDRTEEISIDLEKYPELRETMEKLVPATIPYKDFWKRYYFFRHGIDIAEARRKELLQAASAEEEVGWDEDSDDETSSLRNTMEPKRPSSMGSSTTIHPPANTLAQQSEPPKPTQPRKSNDERSQPDSEISYDVVGAASGNPSNAPNSPKEGRKTGDESDEDWE